MTELRKLCRSNFLSGSETVHFHMAPVQVLTLECQARGRWTTGACLFGGWWTSEQHASVSQGQICSYSYMCCYTEIEVEDQAISSSQYTDTWPTSPGVNPLMPGAWQGNHWSANFLVTGMIQPGKRSMAKVGIEPRYTVCHSWGGLLNH